MPPSRKRAANECDEETVTPQQVARTGTVGQASTPTLLSFDEDSAPKRAPVGTDPDALPRRTTPADWKKVRACGTHAPRGPPRRGAATSPAKTKAAADEDGSGTGR